MKFRTIFFVFNAVILLSFAFTFISPALVLGWADTAPFIARNWPLALGFLAVLAFLDVFFAMNWRLLALLEREDWPALSARLRSDIMAKGRISATRVRLYLNTLMILADLDGAKELEEAVAVKKPRLLEREALLFGLARLLRDDLPGAARLLAGGGGEWRSFYLAFALAKAGKEEEARSGLLALATGRRPAGLAVRGLSAFMARELSPSSAGTDAETADRLKAEEAGKRIARAHGRSQWAKAAEAARREIPGVVMSRYLERASEWLYGSGDAAH